MNKLSAERKEAILEKLAAKKETIRTMVGLTWGQRASRLRRLNTNKIMNVRSEKEMADTVARLKKSAPKAQAHPNLGPHMKKQYQQNVASVARENPGGTTQMFGKMPKNFRRLLEGRGRQNRVPVA